MKGINSVKLALSEITKSLNDEGHKELYIKLKELEANLNEEELIINTLLEIQGYCSIKGLGDLNMPAFTG